jgi:hypothetical protein
MAGGVGGRALFGSVTNKLIRVLAACQIAIYGVYRLHIATTLSEVTSLSYSASITYHYASS